MTLEPPPTDDGYYDLNSLVKSVNESAGPQGYAAVKRRTKVSRKGVLNKAYLKCDRGGKYEVQGHGIRRGHTTMKTESTAPISHPTLRKSFMTPQIEEAIETQSNLDVAHQKIIAGLRVGGDDENPKFLTKDIAKCGVLEALSLSY